MLEPQSLRHISDDCERSPNKAFQFPHAGGCDIGSDFLAPLRMGFVNSVSNYSDSTPTD